MFALKTPSRFLAAAAVASALPMAASANFATNGDFETGDLTGYDAGFLVAGQSFVITTDAAGGQFAGQLTNTVPGTAAPLKIANVGVGSVSPGDTIDISFDAKGVQGVAGVVFAELFSELSGGGTSASALLGGGPVPLTDTYQTFTFSTIAGGDVSGGITLQFNAATGAVPGSTAEIFVDNISIVPEPATAALLGLGGLALLRRRTA